MIRGLVDNGQRGRVRLERVGSLLQFREIANIQILIWIGNALGCRREFDRVALKSCGQAIRCCGNHGVDLDTSTDGQWHASQYETYVQNGHLAETIGDLMEFEQMFLSPMVW